jgi:GATA-binding protein
MAPTPTHPHHLSRETSGDELEMAESLRRLNQTHDNHMPRTENPTHGHQPPSQGDEPPEIYHSLEDAVPISEGPAAPASSASSPLPPSGIIETSASMAGQVCRYVT